MKFIPTALILFIHIISFAATPIIWQEYANSPRILIPLIEGKSAQESVSAYFEKIQDTKSLKALLEKAEIQNKIVDNRLSFSTGKISNLELQKSNRPHFIIVTNELKDLFTVPEGSRVSNIVKRLSSMGADVYVLPVVHDITLTINQSKKYREKLVKYFDAQLVIGGDDIDPYFYEKNISYAKNPIRRRDLSELKFVREFIQAEKGMNFGICRGHQMCAVANHKKLIQDIQIEEGASDIHLNGNHKIQIDTESDIFSVFDSDNIVVNSLHHQAVYVTSDDADYRVVATSDDNIIEAIEFKNGLGHTLQFHPELMHDETGDKILQNFISLTRKNIIKIENQQNCAKYIQDFF